MAADCECSTLRYYIPLPLVVDGLVDLGSTRPVSDILVASDI